MQRNRFVAASEGVDERVDDVSQDRSPNDGNRMCGIFVLRELLKLVLSLLAKSATAR